MGSTHLDKAYADAAKLSAQVGRMVPTWCQGAGGNISVKAVHGKDERLIIKASGFRLDQVRANAGLVEVDLQAFRQSCDAAFLRGAAAQKASTPEAEEQYAKLLQESVAKAAKSLRPSMETGFHAVLSAPLVVHMHSLPAVLMAHEQHADDVSCWLTGKLRGEVAVLPAVAPGLTLLREVARHQDASAVILANHGVILAMQKPEDLATWALVEQEFCQRLGYRRLLRALSEASLPVAALALPPAPMRYYFPDTAVFAARLRASLRQVGVSAPTRRGGKEEALFVSAGEDLDMAEIWAAQQLLYAECPELSELPAELTGSVASLPTERFRIAKSAS